MEIAASPIDIAYVGVLISPVVLIVTATLFLSVATGLAARIAMFVEDISYRRSGASLALIPVEKSPAHPAPTRPDRP